MNKKYKTKRGLPVRILCVDRKHHEHTVVGLVFGDECEYTTSWNSNGCNFINASNSPLDLIEVSPYEDFKVDDLCVVSTNKEKLNTFRYFAKEIEGVAHCFDNGKTSFTFDNETLMAWPNCRKATPEEIVTKTIKV